MNLEGVDIAVMSSIDEFETYLIECKDRKNNLEIEINNMKNLLVSEIEFVKKIERNSLKDIIDSEIIIYVNQLHNKHIINLYNVWLSMNNEYYQIIVTIKWLETLIDHW